MKPVLIAVLMVTVVACSDGPTAKCDQSEKQLLIARMDEANRDLVDAEAAFARVGPLTLQNGDGYGLAMSQRDTARLNVQRRAADLADFAEENEVCFTAAERAELIARGR